MNIKIIAFLLSVSCIAWVNRAESLRILLIADSKYPVSVTTDGAVESVEVLTDDQWFWDEYGQFNYNNFYDDSDVKLLTVPQLKGFRFLGWYTLAEPDDLGFSVSVSSCTNLISAERMLKKETIVNAAQTVRWSAPDDWLVCPKYKKIELVVTFDGNGATDGSMSPVTGKDYESSFTLPSCGFSKTGYSFAGWRNQSGTAFADGQSVKGSDFWVESSWDFDAALSAVWTVKSYTITPSGSNCSVTVAEGASYTDDVSISWVPETQTGHTFAFSSATVTAGGQTLATFTSSPATFNMSKAGKGYYDQVTVNVVYTDKVNTHWINVSSAGNGSVSRDPDKSGYDYGSQVTLTATPNEGYAFERWNDSSTENPRTVTVTSDASYQASFTTRVYTVTFDAGDGTCEPKTKLVKYLDFVGEMPTPKAPYLKQFNGWWSDKTGGVQISELYTRYEWPKDATFYAHYLDAEPVILTVEADPAEGGMVTGGGPHEKGASVQLVATPATGYSFASWSDGGAQTHDVTANVNAKYVATFTGNVYKVRFAFAGDEEGSFPVNSVMVTYGQPYGELPEPVLDDSDLVFDHWADEEEGGNVITSESIVRMHEKTNWLYAHVVPRLSYTVRYFANEAGVMGEMPDQKIYCGSTTNLDAVLFIRTGYVFQGWATESGGSVVYADRAQVEQDLAEAGETLDLYAKWTLFTLNMALQCDSPTWESVATKGNETTMVNVWSPMQGGAYGTFARQTGADLIRQQQYLSATVTESGTLTFMWKGESGEVKIVSGLAQIDTEALTGDGSDWIRATVKISCPVGQTRQIQILNKGAEGKDFDVAAMSWATGPDVPEYAEQDMEMDSFSSADGKLRFQFYGMGRTYHLLGTNDLAAPMPWPLAFETNRAVGPIRFEIPVKPGERQMFYRIRALKE